MRKGQASTTAKIVAYWRMMGDLGMTSVPAFSDPGARKMLTGKAWTFAIKRAEKLAREPDNPTRLAMLPFLDMMILRVAFIDALIAERKPSQVVILGAGLDTRAYRLQALTGVHVIEIDHPDTQAYKRRRTELLGAPLAKLSFAPVDFTHDAAAPLTVALASVGFDAKVPTLWIWEGVIMYLDDQALRRTLTELRQLSAPGSTLLAHYHEPNPPSPRDVVKKVVLSVLGEPQRGLRERAVMRAELERAGFRVSEDAGLPEQAARVGANAPNKPGIDVSRIAVASV
ncbi:MAG TPA: SAM-dependent methyltransferase [Polyangiales bacterium]|nr:SAM-dependent methyltransferase [Polyangiales bacterium]